MGRRRSVPAKWSSSARNHEAQSGVPAEQLLSPPQLIPTGLSISRPDLSVWVVGGDGDMLSIGGNHLIHALRRNINITILMLNNQIYGLTKGQYSPTSELGKVTKSTPFGSIETP